MSDIEIKMTFVDSSILEQVNALYQNYLNETDDGFELSILEDQMLLIAQQEGKTLGFASLSRNSLHPEWITPFVLVAPESQGQGIGKALHEALWQSEGFKTESGFKFGCSTDNLGTQEFLMALDYEKTLECYCICFEINPEHFNKYLNFPESIQNKALKIVSFKELNHPLKQVIGFLVSGYRAEHFWSEPISANHPVWKEVLYDSLNQELSFVIIQDAQILAAVTAESNDEMLNIMHAFTSPDYTQAERVELLQLLCAHQLQAASEQGLLEGDIEIDSTDKTLMSLFDWYPLIEEDIWQIFQKRKI